MDAQYQRGVATSGFAQVGGISAGQPKVPQVAEYDQRLGKILSMVIDLTGQIEDRVSPVLMPVPCVPPRTAEQKLQPVLAPAAERLSQHCDAAENIRMRLHDVLARLEV